MTSLKCLGQETKILWKQGDVTVWRHPQNSEFFLHKSNSLQITNNCVNNQYHMITDKNFIKFSVFHKIRDVIWPDIYEQCSWRNKTKCVTWQWSFYKRCKMDKSKKLQSIRSVQIRLALISSVLPSIFTFFNVFWKYLVVLAVRFAVINFAFFLFCTRFFIGFSSLKVVLYNDLSIIWPTY